MVMSDSVTVRPATATDEAAILQLLSDADLPSAGVVEWLDHFLVAEVNGSLAGVAGLEVHGRDGVLRSVAVEEAARGRGVGARLTARVVDLARERGLDRLYLLTTTAEHYFPRYGFRRIRREDASPEVKNSVEFREACPASAVAMALELAAP